MTTTDQHDPTFDHQIGTRGLVTIRLASAEIRLAGVEGDHVVVRTANSRELPGRVVIEPTEAGITIRERDKDGVSFSSGHKVVQLELDVPVDADVSVDTASGWLDAIGLRGDQRYRTASGEVRIRDGAGRIELNSVSGDAEIGLAGETELAVKSVSGDVAVSGGGLSAIRVGTTSGDVRVDSPILGRTGNQIDTLSGDVSVVAEAGMRVDARTVSGDVGSELPHRSEGRMGRRTLVVGDGSIELSFRSVSGDLRVRDAARVRSGSSSPHRPEAPGGPLAPVRPFAPSAPRPPTPPRSLFAAATATDDTGDAIPAHDPASEDRLAILRRLEAGELDVTAAMQQLAALDEPADETSPERSDG